MYQNYFFDFDGTLYDTYPGMVKAFVEAFALQGIELSASEVYQVMREDSVREAYRRYTTSQLDEAKLHADYRHLEEKYQVQAKPFSGARELLERIIANGGQNFLLTHRDKSSLTLLERDGFLQYFTDHSTADDGFKRKPDPEALNFLVAKYGLDPSVSVMVGDRTLDIIAGHNAKMAGILFDPDKLIKADVHVEQIVQNLNAIE